MIEDLDVAQLYEKITLGEDDVNSIDDGLH
jgi:hypothetical protein